MRAAIRKINIEYANAYGGRHASFRRFLFALVKYLPFLPTALLQLVVRWLLAVRNVAAAEEFLLLCAPRLRGGRQLSVVYRLYKIGSFERAVGLWRDLAAPEIAFRFGHHGLKWTALSCLQIRDYRRALDCILEYRRLKPDTRVGAITQAHALLGLNRREEAEAVVDRYLAKRPLCPYGLGLKRDIARQHRREQVTSPAAELESALAMFRAEAEEARNAASTSLLS